MLLIINDIRFVIYPRIVSTHLIRQFPVYMTSIHPPLMYGRCCDIGFRSQGFSRRVSPLLAIVGSFSAPKSPENLLRLLPQWHDTDISIRHRASHFVIAAITLWSLVDAAPIQSVPRGIVWHLAITPHISQPPTSISSTGEGVMLYSQQCPENDHWFESPG
jgi:hypothetical protein